MAEKLFEFDLGSAGGKFSLHGWPEVFLWLDDERARWSWAENYSDQGATGNLPAEIGSTFNSLRNDLSNYQNQDNQEANVANVVTGVFGQGGRIAYSAGQLGRQIFEIREKAGDDAAMFAYALAKGRVNLGLANSRDRILGAWLWAVPGFGEPAEFAQRLSDERAANTLALHEIDRVATESSRKLDQDWRSMLSIARRVAARSFRRRLALWRAQQDRRDEQAVNAIASIRAVEEQYKVAMGLQAPVQYWQEKASEHATLEGNAVLRLKWFFPVALIILLVAFVVAGWLILRGVDNPVHPATPVAFYVVISAALATLSTFIFWIGRLFTKLYLSEHHLHHDASERAVMTTTYLALIAEQAAGETDRQIILSALFRSTPDGIVKDDGPGEFGLSAILAKFATK